MGWTGLSPAWALGSGQCGSVLAQGPGGGTGLAATALARGAGDFGATGPGGATDLGGAKDAAILAIGLTGADLGSGQWGSVMAQGLGRSTETGCKAAAGLGAGTGGAAGLGRAPGGAALAR